jgi:nickel-dependent lactate racemase
MHIHLAYGKTGLPIELPDTWDLTVIEPRYIPGLPDAGQALSKALREPYNSLPLSEVVKPTDRVGIIFSDITRPTPHQLILPAIQEELTHVPKEQITLFNACGTHRANTEDELRQMLGDELLADYRVIQNDAFDPSSQVCLGRSSFGHEIWINRELAECDVKILTGFIEPHFFAGFSGGGKAIMPGMGGLQTILGNHDAGNIGNPKATWGITHGNPIWEEVQEVAGKGGRLFLVNVTLNKDKEITGVFAGELEGAHAAACAFVKQTAMAPVSEPFDIAITTNSGYPLDLNLYQSVKGMSAAAQVIRQGGAIIVAAECWDGIPEHGLYGKLLREAKSPRELLDRIQSPGFLEQDQWQAQIQALIQMKADVYVYSGYLTDEQIQCALLKPCHSIKETAADLNRLYAGKARICILPEGPQTIPYLALS